MCVSIHAGEDLHHTPAGPVSVFSLHGPIDPRRCPNGPPRRLSGKGALGERPPISPIPLAARRERPGRKGGMVFAISSSREQHGSKIDDPLPESNKRTPENEGPLMGFDRLVMLLINSSDMSAAEAAGTAPPTTYWHHRATSVGRISPAGIDKKVTKVTGDIRKHNELRYDLNSVLMPGWN